MAERKPNLDHGGERVKAARRWIDRALPEWQVFVRDANGRAEHFTISRKRQLAFVAGLAGLAFWAGTATTLLSRQPGELEAKERELEQLLAANRAAQHRLASAEKLVAEIALEVDNVHSNLVTLAGSSVSLTKEAAPAAARAPEPAGEDGGQPGTAEAKAVRDKVRALEESLDRLRVSYARAVEQTADAAQARIDQTESHLARLGLDAARLLGLGKARMGGQGGPFIPASPQAQPEPAVGEMVERLQHWSDMRKAMQRLPLAMPVRSAHEFNSGFGTRNDPLNNRTGMHEGIDLGAPVGTPVFATGEGVVTLAKSWDRYGLTVEIDHGNGITTRYAHLSRIKVKDGQKVTRATVIGEVGNSGRSTGPHLHYEVRVRDVPKNPMKFISVGRDAAQNR